jgi:tRNA dimethylallyltransferase
MTAGVPVLIVTGTTASGKGDLGVELAERLGGEVLSLDSMKVYRGMDVGTSKPTAEDQRRARHHLIDLIGPRDSMNLARFVDLAHAARRDVVARGRVPIAVGGTMMYLHGFLNGVFAGPVADHAFREALRAEARTSGVPALHARLAAADPEAAGRIHPNDYKRIERALEVHAITGEPISALQRRGTRAPGFERRIHVLTFRRDVLDARIDARVLAMFEAGFVDEVRAILDAGGFGREAAEALGYREVVEHLAGRAGLAETVALVQKHTRRFARRQLTWLRKLPGATWHELARETDLPRIPETIAAAFREERGRA